MDYAKNIGNNILKARKKKNMSQSDLADMLHVSQNAISKWERGETMPQIDRVLDLATKLNEPILSLLSIPELDNPDLLTHKIRCEYKYQKPKNEIEKFFDSFNLYISNYYHIVLNEYEYQIFLALKYINPQYDIHDFIKIIQAGIMFRIRKNKN